MQTTQAGHAPPVNSLFWSLHMITLMMQLRTWRARKGGATHPCPAARRLRTVMQSYIESFRLYRRQTLTRNGCRSNWSSRARYPDRPVERAGHRQQGRPLCDRLANYIGRRKQSASPLSTLCKALGDAARGRASSSMLSGAVYTSRKARATSRGRRDRFRIPRPGVSSRRPAPQKGSNR